jgi:hypothetical protein
VRRHCHQADPFRARKIKEGLGNATADHGYTGSFDSRLAQPFGDIPDVVLSRFSPHSRDFIRVPGGKPKWRVARQHHGTDDLYQRDLGIPQPGKRNSGLEDCLR